MRSEDKGMKKIFLALLLISVLLIAGCAYRLDRPEDTTLEFWITQEVETKAFETHTEKYGMFGGSEYYGTGYSPTIDENGQQVDPEHCVIYTVTAYPDYSSDASAITRIGITDPNVKVWGLTINSSEDRIHKTMTENGFEDEGRLIYTKGNITVRFGDGHINISAEVTNRLGIQF